MWPWSQLSKISEIEDLSAKVFSLHCSKTGYHDESHKCWRQYRQDDLLRGWETGRQIELKKKKTTC